MRKNYFFKMYINIITMKFSTVNNLKFINKDTRFSHKRIIINILKVSLNYQVLLVFVWALVFLVL